MDVHRHRAALEPEVRPHERPADVLRIPAEINAPLRHRIGLGKKPRPLSRITGVPWPRGIGGAEEPFVALDQYPASVVPRASM